MKAVIKKIYSLYFFWRYLKGRSLPSFVNLVPPYYIEYPERLIFVGKYAYIGPGSYFSAKGGVEIGNNVIMGPKVSIWSYSHDYNSDMAIPYGGEDKHQEVKICDNVWIGYGVIVLPGTNIGEGSVIGAGSVVKGCFPPCSLIVGNPARIVKRLDTDRYEYLKSVDALYLKKKNELI